MILETTTDIYNKIVTVLQCSDPKCACHRDRGNSRLLHCPGHDDQHPSLSITIKDGRILLRCMASCSQEHLISALRDRGLWYSRQEPGSNGYKAKPQAKRYLVRLAATGEAVGYQVRLDTATGKRIWWEQAAGVKGLPEGISPEDLALWGVERLDKHPGATVVLLEGIAKAEAIQGQLDPDEFVALGGYGASNLPGEASLRPLVGRSVIVAPDADEAGIHWAQQVLVRLWQLGAKPEQLKIVLGYDIADFKRSLPELIRRKAKPVSVEQLESWGGLKPTTNNYSRPLVGSWLLSGPQLLEAAKEQSSIEYLPLLGEEGFVVRGWSHLLAGYPRVGKTELLLGLVAERTQAGDKILYLTEEPQSIWAARAARLRDKLDWSNFTLGLALGVDPAQLLEAVKTSDADLVIVDSIRNLLRPRDETDNSELARLINPWIVACREAGKTLILVHHTRKGGGDHGEGIAGGHALLGAVDIALELTYDKAESRRVLTSYARVIPGRQLAYELSPEGDLRALGSPAAVELRQLQARIQEVLDEAGDWLTTREVRAALGEPQPSDEQVRQALLGLARAGQIERDPDLSTEARGKVVRWRSGQLPTSNNKDPIVVGSWRSSGSSQPEPAEQLEWDPRLTIPNSLRRTWMGSLAPPHAGRRVSPLRPHKGRPAMLSILTRFGRRLTRSKRSFGGWGCERTGQDQASAREAQAQTEDLPGPRPKTTARQARVGACSGLSASSVPTPPQLRRPFARDGTARLAVVSELCRQHQG